MGADWRADAIELLKEYNDNLTSVDNLKEQIKMYEESFTSIRSATTDGTPVQGGNLNKREEMMINNISKRMWINVNLILAKYKISITERGLKSLTDDERKILTLFYINRTKGYIDRLCDDLFISKTELYRQKDEALKRFTKLCYGIVEL